MIMHETAQHLAKSVVNWWKFHIFQSHAHWPRIGLQIHPKVGTDPIPILFMRPVMITHAMAQNLAKAAIKWWKFHIFRGRAHWPRNEEQIHHKVGIDRAPHRVPYYCYSTHEAGDDCARAAQHLDETSVKWWKCHMIQRCDQLATR